MIVEISNKMTVFKKIIHYLFKCPSFWSVKPQFKCPVCSDTYRCYWDGSDIGGLINVCNKCADNYVNNGSFDK